MSKHSEHANKITAAGEDFSMFPTPQQLFLKLLALKSCVLIGPHKQ